LVSTEGSARRVTFGDVLANPEFRAMYLAQALSVMGDQLARLAVAGLVYSRSHSPALTALSFAISYLPWAVGGPLLAGYADRLPRRSVMIACDLARVVLVMLLAIPGLAVPAILALLLLVALLEPPFMTARASMLPDVLGEGEQYAVASTLSNTTSQFGSVLGYGVGGAIVLFIGVRTSIIVDALTFAASALFVVRKVAQRPAVDVGPVNVWDDLRQGASIVFTNGHLRWLVLTSAVLIGSVVTTASISVPYAADHGGGLGTAGLLVAAMQLGVCVGAIILGRYLAPERAERMMLPLALATPAILTLTAFNPPPLAAGIIWFAAGATSAVQIIANRVFVAAVPREVRGRAFGIAAASIAMGQASGALLCGLIAQHMGPAIGVADVALPAFGLICVVSLPAFRSRSSAVAPKQAPGPIVDEDQMPALTRSSVRPQSRVWLYIAALTLAAAAAMPTLHGRAPAIDIHLPAWWLFLLFLIAVSAPLHFVFRRQPWSVQLADVPIVLGLFFLSPLQIVLVRCGAVLIAYAIVRRQPVIRVLYNVSATAVNTILVVAVFRLLWHHGDGVHVSAWPATFAAIVLDAVASVLLVMVVVYLSEGHWNIRQNAQVTAVAIGGGLINTFLALCTASALSYDVNTAWAITVFVVLTITAFRMYHRLADRHAALDKLYAVARELGPIAADPSDLAPALTQLRRIIRADTLELAMLGDDPEFATVVTVYERQEGEGLEIVERELDDDSRSVLTASGVRVLRPGRRLVTQRSRRADDRMAVPVGAQDRPVALLTAHNRSGEIGNFDQSDFRLLEAAAEQLSAALEKGRLVESLRRAATRDSLTNLANLDSLRAFLTTMLDGSAGGVLLLLDIDRFHEINDTLGHDAGDAILIEVARRLESAPTHGALVARVGGDQFALAIPGHAGGEVARLAALAVKSRVDGPLRFDNVSADLRITIGMSRAPEHGTDTATLLRRAEMAMTDAKGSSSGIAEWEPALERDGSRRLNILAGLRLALANNELRVEFQPKIRLGTGDVAGFEALVRWRHPDLGAVSPVEFVPLAEASGLISALTSNVLRLSLDALRRWHDAGRFIGVAVNISARSLDDPVLVGQVAAMLTASGVEPRWLTLEITESSVMENPARSLDVLLQLRSLGVRLSIDDFGTGYSSLHQLRGLPVHEVKIDKAFVDHVDGDGADRAVVRAVVELCESLGLTTVAEGVEQASQAYALESLGVSEVQGYFYGRPMTEAAATEWLIPRMRSGGGSKS
jgi:diguanylate cyclase (GGDEF)-like protein